MRLYIRLARRRLLTLTTHYPRLPLLPHPPTSTSTRTFWSRQTTPNPALIPGIGPIQRLVGSLDTQEGRPPTDDLLLSSFHHLTSSHDTTIPDEHAHGLARTYEYLRLRGTTIPTSDLRSALLALREGTSEHQAGLARVLFGGIVAAEEVRGGDVLAFVGVLCGSGNTGEAVEVTRRYAKTGSEEAWELVLAGFAREGDEESVLQTWEMLERGGVRLGERLFKPVVGFFRDKRDWEAVKVWYGRVWEMGFVPCLETSERVLGFYVEEGRVEWGREVLGMILGKKGGVRKEEWDLVLRWSAVLEGVERVEELLDRMVEAAKVVTRLAPDIETMNGLIRFAISRKDTDMVERFLGSTMKRGFEYNRTTLELQIEYRLLTNDIESARKAYEELRREDIPKNYEAHEAKHLLRALCTDPARDMDKIRQIYLDLNDWQTTLEPETLTTLLSVFLDKCIFQDVIELLYRDCTEYPAKDRRKVIHEIGEYIGRDTTSIEAAWDSYQILYQFFPELSVRQRTDIMRLFFELGRSDMATIVFQHMRGTPGRRPNNYTYTLALMGVAYSRDLDALKAVHNALKLDQFIEPDTMLMNSLMAAYTHCGIPERALQFWEDVKKSREGPDYVSISIMLDTCGQLWDRGIPLARIVWGQLRAMGVKPTLGNYCSYVETLGRRGYLDDCLRIAKDMESVDGVRPDYKLLGTVYATMTPVKKLEVREWAQEKYPEEWAEVDTRLAGLSEDASGEETLERLGIGQLQRLAQQSRRVMLALEEKQEKQPLYVRG